MQTQRLMQRVLVSAFIFLSLTTTSCRAQDITESSAPAETKAAEAKAAVPADGLVYLKVASATVSGFDETPDWAPRPDAMAPFDGDLETRWASAYKDNEWITLDFGKTRTVSKIIIRWEQAYATAYEILASTDNQSWQSLVKREAQAGGVQEIEVPPTACRYLKLAASQRVNAEWGISIWEFEAYGPADKNPGDVPIQEAFKAKKEKSVTEKKIDDIRAKLAGGYFPPSPGPITMQEFQRGINYTSWDTSELDTPMSDYSLGYIADLGVGHIALMVVNYQEDAAAKKIYIDAKKTISDKALTHAIDMIHALGMKVMLKPHVDLADEEARTNIIPSDEWFASYKEFILRYAKIAADNNVEMLCIGTELSNTTTSRWHEKWVDIIAEIKKIYQGKLTYAANWDEYETVSFWSLVDFIGMDAYFPLTEKVNPTKEELIAGWTKHADTLEKWRADNKLTQPIIFTEVGYDAIEGSNKQPWRVLPTMTKYAESQQEQANCLESLLIALSPRSWFKGFYWWNYFPRPDLGPLGYTLRGKLGQTILTDWFKKIAAQETAGAAGKAK